MPPTRYTHTSSAWRGANLYFISFISGGCLSWKMSHEPLKRVGKENNKCRWKTSITIEKFRTKSKAISRGWKGGGGETIVLIVSSIVSCPEVCAGCSLSEHDKKTAVKKKCQKMRLVGYVKMFFNFKVNFNYK